MNVPILTATNIATGTLRLGLSDFPDRCSGFETNKREDRVDRRRQDRAKPTVVARVRTERASACCGRQPWRSARQQPG